MSESDSSPELPQITREQVVDINKKFPLRGIMSPDDMPLNDPEVIEANNLFFAWREQEENKAKRIGTEEALLKTELDITTFYVDAGFTDPDYLDEVANDWLAQLAQSAEDAGLDELARIIEAKSDEIEAMKPS